MRKCVLHLAFVFGEREMCMLELLIDVVCANSLMLDLMCPVFLPSNAFRLYSLCIYFIIF